MRSCRAASVKGFIEKRLLQEQHHSNSQGPAPKTNAMQSTKHTGRHPLTGQPPEPAQDPSAGPRVNKNHQMERNLLFHRAKRLPFADLQGWCARRLRPQVKWGSPRASAGGPAPHRGTAQKGHGRPTSFPPRHVAGEE